MKTLTALDFLIDGILRFIKAHDGERPARLEISPETWRAVCESPEALVYPRDGAAHTRRLHGVPVVLINGVPPRLFARDGKLEEI